MQRSAPVPGPGDVGLPPGYVLAAMPLPPGMSSMPGMPEIPGAGSGSGSGSGSGQSGGPAPLGVWEVVRRVRARWVLATVPLLVGVVGGGVLTFSTEPVYTARAAVLVQPVIAEQFGNVNIGNVLNMATEAEVAQSLSVAETAGKQLGVPPDEVMDALSVTTAQDTEVLKISYRAGTAEVAALGAQTVATSYLGYREANAAADADRRLASIAEQVALITRLLAAGGETSSYQDILRELLADRRELTSIKATSGGRVITEAVPPSSRTAPKPVTNLVGGGIAGGMIGLALAVFWPARRRRTFVVPTSAPEAAAGGAGADPGASTGSRESMVPGGSGRSGPLRPRGSRRIPVQPAPVAVPATEPTSTTEAPRPTGSWDQRRQVPGQPVPDGPRRPGTDGQSVPDDEQWWSKRA